MKSVSLVVLTILIMCVSCQKEYTVSPSKNNVVTPVVSYANYPAAGQWATLVFEDNWPKLGDYDMNDMVVAYRYSFGKDKNGKVLTLNADFTVVASGASLHNGLGIDLPIDASLVKSVTGQRLDAGYIKLNANGTEVGQTDAVIIPFDNHEDLLHYYDYSYFINVDPAKPRITGDTVHVVVTFTKPLDKSYVSKAPFNPFLISDMRRDHEVHLAGEKPTDKASKTLFNTDDDNSKAGTYYLSKEKYPWALNFTSGSFAYPVERSSIKTAYLHYQEWILSGGKRYTDWYSNTKAGYRNDASIFY